MCKPFAWEAETLCPGPIILTEACGAIINDTQNAIWAMWGKRVVIKSNAKNYVSYRKVPLVALEAGSRPTGAFVCAAVRM